MAPESQWVIKGYRRDLRSNGPSLRTHAPSRGIQPHHQPPQLDLSKRNLKTSREVPGQARRRRHPNLPKCRGIYSRSLFKMMVFSCLLSAIFTVTGLWISFALNLTSGASIILVAGTGFLISLALERIIPKIYRRASSMPGE